MRSVFGLKSHDGVLQAYGAHATHLLERVRRAQHEIALRVVGQHRVELVDPAVDADLVPFGHHAALLVGVDEGRDGGHVEGGLDAVLLEDLEDARHAHAVAVLSPAKPPDRLAAVPQLVRLMIGVEREGDGAAGAVLPRLWPERPAGAHAAHELAPMLLRPLPGFESGGLHVHDTLHGKSLGEALNGACAQLSASCAVSFK